MTRLILADDHQMFRSGLKQLLTADKLFKVVGQAANGVELMDLLAHTKADCIILDLSMPEMDGLESLKEITAKYPKLRCLVLTMQQDVEHFKCAIAYGAKGYVLKDCAFEELSLAIKTVMKDKQFVSPAISSLITDAYIQASPSNGEASLEILTNRERDVLKLVAAGLANKNIATQLKISIRTVETHRSRIIHKLGIKTTAGLVKYALAKGIIS